MFIIQSNFTDLYYGGYCFEAGRDIWVSRDKAHQYGTAVLARRVILLNALQARYVEV